MKIAYVFTDGRRRRLERLEAGAPAPTEFLLGVPELQQMGHEVTVFELADFQPGRSTAKLRRIERRADRMEKCGLTSSGPKFGEDEVKRLNAFDAVLAGNEYVGLGLADWAMAGVLERPLSIFVMGMFAKVFSRKVKGPTSWWRRRLGMRHYARVANAADTLFFVGRPEMERLTACFPRQRDKCRFTPFPVDVTFWQTDPSAEVENYVLFVGNDLRRDFDLLLAIAQQMPHRTFRCVSKRVSPADAPPNLEVLGSDWYSEAISDLDMRSLYQRCRLVILPVTATHQPSGQSVAQQAMACGRPVAVSRFPGLWMDQLTDGRCVELVESATVEAWRVPIDRLCDDAEAAADLGQRGRKMVCEHVRPERFAASVIDALDKGKTRTS